MPSITYRATLFTDMPKQGMTSSRSIRTGRLAGILAAALVIGGALYNESRPPSLHSIAMPGDDPFTLRFAISNPAFTITMKDVDLSCVPMEARGHPTKDGKPALHATPFALNVDVDLPPRGAYEYTCPIRIEGAADATGTLDAKIGATYTRLGYRAKTWSRELSWDAASRTWTEATD